MSRKCVRAHHSQFYWEHSHILRSLNFTPFSKVLTIPITWISETKKKKEDWNGNFTCILCIRMFHTRYFIMYFRINRKYKMLSLFQPSRRSSLPVIQSDLDDLRDLGLVIVKMCLNSFVWIICSVWNICHVESQKICAFFVMKNGIWPCNVLLYKLEFTVRQW